MAFITLAQSLTSFPAATLEERAIPSSVSAATTMRPRVNQWLNCSSTTKYSASSANGKSITFGRRPDYRADHET